MILRPDLRAGDTLVVWKLDRLGRSHCHLLDTSTAAGKLVFNLFAALAEFDRDLMRERTVAGMQAAIARGRHLGRKPALSDEQLRQARAMIAAGGSETLSVRLPAASPTRFPTATSSDRSGGHALPAPSPLAVSVGN